MAPSAPLAAHALLPNRSHSIASIAHAKACAHRTPDTPFYGRPIERRVGIGTASRHLLTRTDRLYSTKNASRLPRNWSYCSRNLQLWLRPPLSLAGRCTRRSARRIPNAPKKGRATPIYRPNLDAHDLSFMQAPGPPRDQLPLSLARAYVRRGRAHSAVVGIDPDPTLHDVELLMERFTSGGSSPADSGEDGSAEEGGHHSPTPQEKESLADEALRLHQVGEPLSSPGELTGQGGGERGDLAPRASPQRTISQCLSSVSNGPQGTARREMLPGAPGTEGWLGSWDVLLDLGKGTLKPPTEKLSSVPSNPHRCVPSSPHEGQSARMGTQSPDVLKRSKESKTDMMKREERGVRTDKAYLGIPPLERGLPRSGAADVPGTGRERTNRKPSCGRPCEGCNTTANTVRGETARTRGQLGWQINDDVAAVADPRNCGKPGADASMRMERVGEAMRASEPLMKAVRGGRRITRGARIMAVDPAASRRSRHCCYLRRRTEVNCCTLTVRKVNIATWGRKRNLILKVRAQNETWYTVGSRIDEMDASHNYKAAAKLHRGSCSAEQCRKNRAQAAERVNSQKADKTWAEHIQGDSIIAADQALKEISHAGFRGKVQAKKLHEVDGHQQTASHAFPPWWRYPQDVAHPSAFSRRNETAALALIEPTQAWLLPVKFGSRKV
ncbi:hypothetical protein Efla_002514 [Eimeria flavescens]